MSRRRVAICIEGIPYVLGDYLPSWHDGSLVNDLVETPTWMQEIDALGGVAKVSDIDLEIADTIGRWASLLRVAQPTIYYAISPNPIEHDTTVITMRDATDISADDILYAERDTWSVDSVTDDEVTVTRQVYTCLEDGWKARYQTGVTREETVIVSPDGPPIFVGRLVTIYVNDVLEYIGQIVDLKQRGRVWRVTCRWYLSVLASPITAPNAGVRLRHEWNYNFARWGAGGERYAITAGATRGGDLYTMIDGWVIPSQPAANLTSGLGWVWIGNDSNSQDNPPEIEAGGLQHGAAAALGDSWEYDDSTLYCTRRLGVKPYGVMFACNGPPDYLDAHEIHIINGVYDLDQYEGSYLRCGDQVLRVQGVDTVNGRVYFDLIVEANSGTPFRELSAGTSGEVPIELVTAGIVSAQDLITAIQDVITGDGPLGLGLPSGLISTAPVTPVGGNHPVWWDWESGGIDDDLRARGIAVALVDGLITAINVTPPYSTQSVATIDQADLVVGSGPPEIDRGHESPAGNITYTGGDQDEPFTASVSYSGSTGPGQSALRVISLQSATRDRIIEVTSWIRAQANRLAWLAPGIPVIGVRLTSAAHAVGQVVLLSSRYISDGNYRTKDIPCLIIGRDPIGGRYQLAANIGRDIGAMWALSLVVIGAASTVISVDSADLAVWEEYVPIGADVLITEHDQSSVLWSGTIVSYGSGTVTLSSAPTIAADEVVIITCADVGSTGHNSLTARQVFAGDSAGEIEGEPCRVLV